MIWLWRPALENDPVTGLATVLIPETFPTIAEEKIIDPTITRNFCYLRDPDFIDDITKPYKVITKRSMNDRVRTYVTYDVRYIDHIMHTISFQGLTTNRLLALRQFIQNSEGQSIGYKTPDDRYFAATLLTTEATLTTNHPGLAGKLDEETDKEIVSEWGITELSLLLIKEGTI